jgi:hypothetical protein
VSLPTISLTGIGEPVPEAGVEPSCNQVEKRNQGTKGGAGYRDDNGECNEQMARRIPRAVCDPGRHGPTLTVRHPAQRCLAEEMADDEPDGEGSWPAERV